MKAGFDIGEAVKDSGMGAGTITGFSDRGFPMVNHVTCAWLEMDDGRVFDPYGVMEKHKADREPQGGNG